MKVQAEAIPGLLSSQSKAAHYPMRKRATISVQNQKKDADISIPMRVPPYNSPVDEHKKPMGLREEQLQLVEQNITAKSDSTFNCVCSPSKFGSIAAANHYSPGNQHVGIHLDQGQQILLKDKLLHCVGYLWLHNNLTPKIMASNNSTQYFTISRSGIWTRRHGNSLCGLHGIQVLNVKAQRLELEQSEGPVTLRLAVGGSRWLRV